jgi:DNA-binding response OmpR family regulator
MKEERLDQILLRLGYVTEQEIEQALLRQKSRGGRLGTHLAFFKFMTDKQLAHALSEQFRVPCFDPDKHEISSAVVQTISQSDAEDCEAIPIWHDDVTGTVTAVAVDPDDDTMITRIKRAFAARDVNVLITSESLFRVLIARYYRGEEAAGDAPKIVELPELFEQDVAEADVDTAQASSNEGSQANVLMLTRAKTIKDFLAPVFEREGLTLRVASTQREIRDAFKDQSIDRILVSEDLLEQLSQWTREEKVPTPKVEVSAFSSVSGALLDNPVPYRAIIRSLFRSLQTAAEARTAQGKWKPSYAQVSGDIARLARVFGFRRLAVDGIRVAAYLLTPAGVKKTRDGALRLPGFADTDRSLAVARSLEFPWDLEELMRAFFELIDEGERVAEILSSRQEVSVGAQILVMVWYQHFLAQVARQTRDLAARFAVLRQCAGRLASPETIEAYVQLLADDRRAESQGQVFIVGRRRGIFRKLGTRLSRLGFRTLELDDLDEAQRLCERHPPAAVVIDRESFPDRINQAARLFKLRPTLVLYAFTDANGSSSTLDLLDAGFDDVFTPPYDYDVIAVRMNKALRAAARRPPAARATGQFSASFEAFAFVDLLQALGQSLKTVRIDLENHAGESAVIYMLRGQIVYAACGDIAGSEAVFRVIAWGDKGAFSVSPTDDFPPANVSEPNEAILMEGCRLLDESQAK